MTNDLLTQPGAAPSAAIPANPSLSETTISSPAVSREEFQNLMTGNYATNAYNLWYAMKGGIGMGTTEETINATMAAMADYTPQQKQEFINFYNEHYAQGSSLDAHLRSELNMEDYAEAMMKFYGKDPALSEERAKLVNERLQIKGNASEAEIIKLISYLSEADKLVLVSKFPELLEQLRVHPRIGDNIRVVASLMGSEEAKAAGELYTMIKSGQHEQAHAFLSNLTPEQYQKTAAVFQEMFKTPLVNFLHNSLPDYKEAQFDAIVAAKTIPQTQIATGQQPNQPAPPTDAQQSASTQAAPTAPVQPAVSTSNVPVHEASLTVGEVPQSEIKLYLDPDYFKEMTPLRQAVYYYERVRNGGSATDIAELQRILNAHRGQLKQWQQKIMKWGPEKEPFKNAVGYEAQAEIVKSRRREYHIEVLELFNNPDEIDPQKIRVSGQGLTSEQYHARLKRLQEGASPKAEPEYELV